MRLEVAHAAALIAVRTARSTQTMLLQSSNVPPLACIDANCFCCIDLFTAVNFRLLRKGAATSIVLQYNWMFFMLHGYSLPLAALLSACKSTYEPTLGKQAMKVCPFVSKVTVAAILM